MERMQCPSTEGMYELENLMLSSPTSSSIASPSSDMVKVSKNDLDFAHIDRSVVRDRTVPPPHTPLRTKLQEKDSLNNGRSQDGGNIDDDYEDNFDDYNDFDDDDDDMDGCSSSSHASGDEETRHRQSSHPRTGSSCSNRGEDVIKRSQDHQRIQRRGGDSRDSYGSSNVSSSISSSTGSGADDDSSVVHLLGRSFHPVADGIEMRRLEKELYWFTYRNEVVVPLSPYQSSLGSHVSVLMRGGFKANLLDTAGCEANTDKCQVEGDVEDDGQDNGVSANSRGMRTDAGWGCMLRSAQMLMAETVRRHYSPHASPSRKEDCWEVERIARWFADFPNDGCDDVDFQLDRELTQNTLDHPVNAAGISNVTGAYGTGGIHHHWYSLHQMVAAGLGMGVLPGEWYGPGTACHVLKELNEIHCWRRHKLGQSLQKQVGKRQWVKLRGNGGESKLECKDQDEESNIKNQLECDMFRIHVANDGCIYMDAITQLMTKYRKKHHKSETTFNPTDEDPLHMYHSSTHVPNPNKTVEWDTSLLLLLPLRLGLQSFQSGYATTLSKLMSFPHSVGMLGGTPRHALWFYGAEEPPTSDADPRWYGLDPHTVQPAPRGKRVPLPSHQTNLSGDSRRRNGSKPPRRYWQAHITDGYLRSLHHALPIQPISLSKLDPSCALGFYIRDARDFDHFRTLLTQLEQTHCRPNKLPVVVTIETTTPNYEADISMAMQDLIGKGEEDMEGDFEKDEKNDDFGSSEEDEDDYVLI